jgi:hypothetical protein
MSPWGWAIVAQRIFGVDAALNLVGGRPNLFAVLRIATLALNLIDAL